MKNYGVMGKEELIREIEELLEKQDKKSAGSKKTVSRLHNKTVGHSAETRREAQEEPVEERFLLQESCLAVMEELVGNIAHQWRQPLNIIGLTVQKLQFDFERKDVDESYINEMVNEVLDTVKHMSRTVQSFRDFMQIDRKRELFSLNDSLQGVLSFVEGSMKSAGVSVSLDDGNEDLTVSGLRNEFCRIMLSMFNSSRKILLQNKIENPSISVRLSRTNGRCVISFRDNGGCLPSVEGVFEPHPASGSRGNGNGLGLFLAKEIIERKMGGKLTANNLDDGVEFRIELDLDAGV
ncbi:MAG TPA: HAMP domain-containing sensor histidine kinase [Geobacteraceae bacterium]|nr:HAMP domain-containing sensor histidine kinase [Geobacteraceae bacterium]